MQPLRRTIHPQVRVIDAKRGLVDYVASDESVDSYRELIRAKGWRFTHFAKNAPFVDSHDYSSVGRVLGQVVDFKVSGNKLIERVQWAIDVGNPVAELGWKMTAAGYLRAVSVGFYPIKSVSQSSMGPDRTEYLKQLTELGLEESNGPRTIYLEQEQIELSAVVLGANPNALAKARAAGVITAAESAFLHDRSSWPLSASGHIPFPEVLPANLRKAEDRADFLARFNEIISRLSPRPPLL